MDPVGVVAAERRGRQLRRILRTDGWSARGGVRIDGREVVRLSVDGVEGVASGASDAGDRISQVLAEVVDVSTEVVDVFGHTCDSRRHALKQKEDVLGGQGLFSRGCRMYGTRGWLRRPGTGGLRRTGTGRNRLAHYKSRIGVAGIRYHAWVTPGQAIGDLNPRMIY